MSNHTDEINPPPIAPLPLGLQRPLWSVMIPTFNCAKYLRQTLESVLAQDPGPEQMQIEVIDDCSTKDDPEAVVQEVGRGRVQFYRKPQNGGAVANFNTCIERSRGHLVHILHGDDYILPGFYHRICEAAKALPNCSGFFSRSFVVSANGEIESLYLRLDSLERAGNNPEQMFYNNHILTPSAVVRRRFYELHGGFRTDLVHVADWEMWIRVISAGMGLFINFPLAAYRFFHANDTGRLAKRADNLRDYMRLAEILRVRFPAFDWSRFAANVAAEARRQSNWFRSIGDEEAACANDRLAAELTPAVSIPVRLKRTAALLYRSLFS